MSQSVGRVLFLVLSLLSPGLQGVELQWLEDRVKAELGERRFDALPTRTLKGKALLFGLAGKNQDRARVESLLKQAVEAGEACGLCELWWRGQYFSRDPGLAYRCFLNEKNHFWLAYLNAFGIGTRKDPVKALEFARQCQAGGRCPDERIVVAAEGRPGSYYDDPETHNSPYWWVADDTNGSVFAVRYERDIALIEQELRCTEFEGAFLGQDGRGAAKQLLEAYLDVKWADIKLQFFLDGSAIGTNSREMEAADQLESVDAFAGVLRSLETMGARTGRKKAFEIADRRLNESYKSAKHFAKGEDGSQEVTSGFGDALVESQRKWIKFRDRSARVVALRLKAEPALAQEIAWQVGEAMSLERADFLDSLRVEVEE